MCGGIDNFRNQGSPHRTFLSQLSYDLFQFRDAITQMVILGLIRIVSATKGRSDTWFCQYCNNQLTRLYRDLLHKHRNRSNQEPCIWNKVSSYHTVSGRDSVSGFLQLITSRTNHLSLVLVARETTLNRTISFALPIISFETGIICHVWRGRAAWNNRY